MNLIDLFTLCEKPEIYSPSTSLMWTDPYISRNLLQIHLNPKIDLGSRRPTTIQKTSEWILSLLKRQKSKIADLGCGPGLYAEHFAQSGHSVIGVDISTNSLNYAQHSALEKGLDIEYRNENYLNLGIQSASCDLVVLIYTDFGVLLPDERSKLLSHVYRILKPGGIFIFDVVNDKQIEGKLSPKSWECAKSGFWKDKPYLLLSDSFFYDSEKVILFQHTVLSDDEKPDIYRFWTHLFSHDRIRSILLEHGFKVSSFHEDILPEGDSWSGENVTFTVTQKP